MTKTCFFIFCLLFSIGCVNPFRNEGRPNQDLKQYKWYYSGSKKQYHYFYYTGFWFTHPEKFKVHENDHNIESPFPVTRDRKEWRMMAWSEKESNLRYEKFEPVVKEHGNRQFVMAYNIRFDSVQKGAVGLSGWYGHIFEGIPYGSNGFIIQVEPGLGGGKINLGYGMIVFMNDMRDSNFIIDISDNPAFGIAGYASVLRTWGDPWGAEPDQTYLGVELEGVMFMFHGIVGAYRHIGGSDNKNDWLFSVGTGVGF